MTKSTNKLLVGLVLALAAVAAGCGDSGGPAAAPGSEQNPVQAEPPSLEVGASEPTGKDGESGFEQLLEQQRRTPARKDRSNPCALVTKAQAQQILGTRLLDPVMAPQGPTCIYRDRSGRSFATVAFQATGIQRLRRAARRVHAVEVGDRTAYCAVNGAPVLYLPLAAGRVLSVNAQCEIATRFASRALPHLAG